MNHIYSNVTILYEENKKEEADRIRNLLSCRAIPDAEADAEQVRKEDGLILRVAEDGLSLEFKEMRMRGDFTKMLPRLKNGRLQQEMLVKAVRFRKMEEGLTAVDATAGMGEDSLLIAAAGFEVHLYEHNQVIALLLEDTIRRSLSVPELDPVVRRLHLHFGDSITGMRKLGEEGIVPEVVFLDPMFPERRKSGLIQKKFQILQQLEVPCRAEEELLHAALQTAARKVVVKRPAKGPVLGDVKPGYVIRGSVVRYDCIVISG